MRGNNTGTWKRRPQLPEHRLPNSPSPPWPCDAKLSLLTIRGVLPCNRLDCPEGSFPWKIRQLEANSTAIDCSCADLAGPYWRSSTMLFSRSIVLLLPFCRWAYAEKEKDFLACLPPLSLKQQVSLATKTGVLCLSSSARVHRSPIKQWLVCGSRVGYIQWNKLEF